MPEPVVTDSALPPLSASPLAAGAASQAISGGVLAKLRRHPRWTAVVVLALLVMAGTGFYFGPWQWWTSPSEESGSEHWQAAQQALQQRDLSTAISHLEECVKIWPLNAEAHFLLARTYRRAGALPYWNMHLRRARLLLWPPDQIQLERQLAQAQSGEIWPVEDKLVKILRDLPSKGYREEEVLILEALVQGLMDNDRLDEVVEYTSDWIERYPDDWLAWFYRGRASLILQLGQTTKALADFQRVLQLKPDHATARLSLASAYMKNGQWEEALENFQIYLQSQPDDPDALYGVANCKQNLADTQGAQAALDKLLAKYANPTKGSNPAKEANYALGLSLRAKMDMAAGKPKEALKSLLEAEKLAPSKTDILDTKPLILRELGRIKEAEKARKDFEKVEKELRDLDQTMMKIKKDPENVELRYQAGMLCLGLGQDVQASHWFQTVIRIDPNNRKTWQALADYWEKKKNDPNHPLAAKRAAYYRLRAQGKR